MAQAVTPDTQKQCPPHPLARGRVRLFLAVMVVLMLGLSLKLLDVQVISRGHYLVLDAHIHRGPDPETPVPGGIFARDLEPMAMSVPLESIYADAVKVAGSELGVEGTVAEIASLAGLNAQEVRSRLLRGVEKRQRSLWLARLLEPDSLKALKENLPQGVWTEREYKRVYPGGRLACHVLGKRSPWHEPLEGTELRWAFLLDGRPGTRPRNVDSYGRSILGADSSGILAPEPGKNLVLTLDWSLQEVAELALDDCMERSAPKSATCVVMDPRTGEILALASRPNYDPGGGSQGTAEEVLAQHSNLPVIRQYEPGSLFKVLLAAAVLKSDEYKGQSYSCSGYSPDVGGQPLRCWDPRGHGNCDLTNMITHSCNIAAANFAMLIGAEHYHAFLQTLGIGAPMGIGLPGEASGLLHPTSGMRRRDLANLGFGQGVSVTDIQMLSAICAVANGGRLMQPHIVRAVMDARTNRPVREIEPLKVRDVCTEEVSARVRERMGTVSDRGTGHLAAIDGVRMGGKTGTAQKWLADEGGFSHGRNIVSFVMVAPLDEPRFAILVTADEPSRGEHGSDVAAPVAKTVAMVALREAGLLPEQAAVAEDEEVPSGT